MAEKKALRKTPLHDVHVKAGARMVPFGGWHMPVQYTSIVAEHRAVRASAGLFDVSHMGEFVFEGSDAKSLLQWLTTNDLDALDVGTCHYAFYLNDRGGVVDDSMIYRSADETFISVVNASNIEKDWAHVTRVKNDFPGARVSNRSAEWALLALQGPRASETLSEVADESLAGLPFHHLREAALAGVHALVAASGYTGENGYEVFVPASSAVTVWDALVGAGEAQGLALCGLGARDTLRLEASLALYGHELDEQTTPLEARLGFAVSDRAEFLGCQALREQREHGVRKRLVMLELTGRGIPRQGYPVTDATGREVGVVTSGSVAPWLEKSIAMAFVAPDSGKTGSRMNVIIRGRAVECVVVKRPFYSRPKK